MSISESEAVTGCVCPASRAPHATQGTYKHTHTHTHTHRRHRTCADYKVISPPRQRPRLEADIDSLTILTELQGIQASGHAQVAAWWACFEQAHDQVGAADRHTRAAYFRAQRCEVCPAYQLVVCSEDVVSAQLCFDVMHQTLGTFWRQVSELAIYVWRRKRAKGSIYIAHCLCRVKIWKVCSNHTLARKVS